jgi:hypothetical protein
MKTMVKKIYLIGEASKKLRKLISKFEKNFNVNVPDQALISVLCMASDINGHVIGSNNYRQFNDRDIIAAYLAIKVFYMKK